HLLALVAVPENLAVLRVIDTVDDVEHRTLASPVRADDGADLMLADVEGNVGQRLDPAEAQGNVLQVEDDVADFLAAHRGFLVLRRIQGGERRNSGWMIHVHAAFFTIGKVLASMIRRSADTLPRRPSSNLTSVSMNWLALPEYRASISTLYFSATKLRRTLR